MLDAPTKRHTTENANDTPMPTRYVARMPTLRATGSDTNVATRPVTLHAVSMTAAMATSPNA